MFPVKWGVRQGGVLSPWLFLCFNSDIPEILKQIDSGLKVDNIHCNSVLVTDDITLLSLRVKGLQGLLSALNRMARNGDFIYFNSSKTVEVTFEERTTKNSVCKLTMEWYLSGVKIT
jgi:hypothetical protein